MAPIPPLHAREILDAISSRATTILHSFEQNLHLQHRNAFPPANAQIESLLPTRTLAGRISHILHTRQAPVQSSIIPSTYGAINNSQPPGTIVGIVLGSVAGFLLLLYLFYTCMNFGSSNSSESSASVVVRRPKSRSTRTRSRRASETVEVRRDRTPVRIVREPERVERVVVEERVSREVPRRERSIASSDEVIVIEEHSPPRRKKSNRGERRVRESVVVEEDRRDSGFRTVDPLAYGGTVGGSKRASGGRR